MNPISLVGVASYLPETIVSNDFFAPGAGSRRGMFTAPTTRRHVKRDETATSMIEMAAKRLVAKLRLDPSAKGSVFTSTRMSTF